MKFSTWFTVCILFLSGVYGAVAEDTYKIDFSSDSEVGDKAFVSCHGTSSESLEITADGRTVQGMKFYTKAELEGIVTVFKVDKKKRPVEVKLVIGKCLASFEKGKPLHEVFQKGAEIIITQRGGKDVFLFHDKPLPENLKKMLQLFISMPASDVTDNDIFAPKERKKVGDKWSINSKVAAADLTAMGMKVRPEDVTGTVKLEKVMTVGDTECLFLSGFLDIKNIHPALPAGLRITRSSAHITLQGELPADPDVKSYDPLSSDTGMDMELHAEGRPAPDKPLIKFTAIYKKNVHIASQNLKTK